MPRIPEYSNQENISPVDRGANAWEGAARRLGGLYNAAASNVREGGQVEGRAFKQRLWPFDIQELYSRQAARDAEEAAALEKKMQPAHWRVSGRGIGAGTDTDHWGGGRGGETSESLANASGGYGGGGYAANGQISRGAGALGNMLADGGRAISRREGKEGDTYTSSGGRLITSTEAQKAEDTYNQERSDAIAGEGSRIWEAQRYWDRYYGNNGTVNSTWRGEGAETPGYVTGGGTNYRPPAPPTNDPPAEGWGGMTMRGAGLLGSDATTAAGLLAGDVGRAISSIGNWITGPAASADIPR